MPRKPVNRESADLNGIVLTFDEAQSLLRVSHQTLYNWIDKKKTPNPLPSHKIGRRRMFLKEEIEAWIKEH
jgi:excisionase family DNA binding protein